MAEGERLNGVDLQRLTQAAHDFGQDPELASFEFRVRNEWLDGGRNRSIVEAFHGTKEEHAGRHFEVDADEPPVLLGGDAAPNPVEILMSALASCLTTSIVYHAAARGISIESCACELSGVLDIRGFLGVAPEVRPGYQRIDATFHVVSDGDERTLEECARFSPVYDVVTKGTEVGLKVIAERAQARADRRPDGPSVGQAHPS